MVFSTITMTNAKAKAKTRSNLRKARMKKAVAKLQAILKCKGSAQIGRGDKQTALTMMLL